MNLLITTRGSLLHKKGETFQIKTPEKKTEVPISKVESIWIATAAMLSTDVIKSALEHNIDIVFLDDFGDPMGRVWHPKLGSTTLIRRRQLEVAEDNRGLRLVKEWEVQKMENQVALLKKLRRGRPGQDNGLEETISEISTLREEMLRLSGTADRRRQTILGLEGRASRLYFSAIAEVLPERWTFKERSRRPAKDLFNATLNYGYGVLYGIVERACILSGLDPYVGILHTDSYNKKSFVFDFIEGFRAHIDEPVVFLFTKKRMHERHIEPFEGGVGLSKEGKALLMHELNTRFDQEIAYRGKNMKVRNVILAEAHALANRLIQGV
ncbi:MAG: CRISPR-associated endonuclease Cas1 [Methanofollis sp.]|jgi:CRISPR-associated protein Cas1|nr:CRISPR-associated endonuclease Cas1 [Methanofollis sp.]